jgi:hypothetical protein
MAENWATAEGFFKCTVPRQKMDIPDLGLIWVYGLESGEKDEYENSAYDYQRQSDSVKLKNARARLLQMTVRNQHGQRLFAEKDMGKLAALPAAVADPILDVARKLSGMREGEIEQLVKNSQMTQQLKSSGSDSG